MIWRQCRSGVALFLVTVGECQRAGRVRPTILVHKAGPAGIVICEQMAFFALVNAYGFPDFMNWVLNSTRVLTSTQY